MPYQDVLFHGFDNRRERNVSVKRWRLFDTMFYRTNLEDHGEMVAWVVAEMLPYARKAFPRYLTVEREKEALTLALVHDDHEPVSIYKDVSSFEKAHLNPKQLELFNGEEERAIRELVAGNPTLVNGFVYRDLLWAAQKKDQIVSQLVSYGDKVVGFGEAMHEVYAGNDSFVEEEVDGLRNRPVERYRSILLARHDKFPLLGPLFNYKHPFLNLPQRIDVAEIARGGSPHSIESFRNTTGHAMYDHWRKVILERGGFKGLEMLVRQKEFIGMGNGTGESRLALLGRVET